MHVPRWTDWLSGQVERHPGFWIGLGRWETRALSERLDDVLIDRPVYIAGLARSGTTVLLELLAGCANVATHRYRDFPAVLTPWLWSRFWDHAVRTGEQPVERAHGDRIRVTSESPEAFEEMVWMAFFPEAHDPERSSVLDHRTDHPHFERFYRDHVRKILLLRDGSRYVAKGNYNLTRLEYLRKLAPDARFVIPVRDPVAHVASLARQHERFVGEGRRDDRVRKHLRRSGHFEFGMDRRPIHTGDPAGVDELRSLWSEGREIEGWAAYWSLVYAHVLRSLEASPALADAVSVVRYEDLCARPGHVLSSVLAHCQLNGEDAVQQAEQRVRPPDYYHSPLDDADVETVRERTRRVAAALGYGQDRPTVGRS